VDIDGGMYRLRDDGAVFSFPLAGRTGDFDKRRLPTGFDIALAGREWVVDGGVESLDRPPVLIGIRDVAGGLRCRIPR